MRTGDPSTYAPGAGTSQPPARGRYLSPLARTLLRACWTLACLAVLGAAVSLFVSWRVYGLVPIVIVGGSMEPSIPRGSLAFDERVDAEDVRRGDVITFTPQGSKQRVTHRVVGRELRKGKWYFTTKGDANGDPDAWSRLASRPATASDMVAYDDGMALRTRFHIPKVGHAYVAIRDAEVRRGLVWGGMALLLLALVSAIWRPARRVEPATAVTFVATGADALEGASFIQDPPRWARAAWAAQERARLRGRNRPLTRFLRRAIGE